MSNVRANLIGKKAVRWLWDSVRIEHSEYNRPPLFINSIPKSGTHLVHQVVEPLCLSDKAGFVASTPSFTMREQSAERTALALRKIFDNELMLGHVFFSTEAENALSKLGIPVVFIYRDPRDILLSEINYLSNMNRFHKLHKIFSNCVSFDEKFNLALNGVDTGDFYYPAFEVRIGRYLGWLDSSIVQKVRFEDLRDLDKRQVVVEELFDFFTSAGLMIDREENYVEKSLAAIMPEKSHTFSGGNVGRWHSELSSNQIHVLNERLANVISVMGYER